VGKTEETIPGKSPKVAFFARNGGFLFPERWLFKNGMGGFFAPDYASKSPTTENKSFACTGKHL